MNAKSLHRIFFALISAISLFTAGGANAQLFRAYLSTSGNDANPCTLPQPCRLLPAALAAVANGGDIWMLDSANYNAAPVIVTKSVVILAVPGVVGSVVASGGDAIDIAASNVQVTLRNLVLRNFSAGGHAINFSQGARLLVEECEIYGMPLDGIHVTAPGSGVTIKNTTIHSNQGTGIFLAGNAAVDGVNASIEHVTLFQNAGGGIDLAGSARATVAWSLIQNAPTGIAASESLAGLGVRLQIHDSVIRNTTKGILLTSSNSTPGGSDTVRVTLNRSNMANNTTAIDVESPPPGDAKMTLDENVIQNNTTAVNFNGGVVFSRGNNTMNFSTNGIVGGSLTALSGV